MTRGGGDSFHGVALPLGDGLTVPDVASPVAVGCEWPIDKSVLVTVHSHPSLVVRWTKKVDGDGTVATYAHTTTLAGETETYDAASNPRSTIGLAHGRDGRPGRARLDNPSPPD